MNTHGKALVPARIGGICTRLLSPWALTVWACVVLWGGCVEVEGGAVEFTWSFRSFEGKPIGLDTACSSAKSPISHIRLCWSEGSANEDFCVPGNFRDFPCSKQAGATLFEVPEGPTSLRIVPICEDGNPAERESYQVPADIVRTVQKGEIVSLDALLVVIVDPSTCSGAECTCVR